MTADLKRLTVRLPLENFIELKIIAAKQQKSVNKIMLEAISYIIEKYSKKVI